MWMTKLGIFIFYWQYGCAKISFKNEREKPDLDKLAKEIWTWCEERGLWLIAFFIPGIDNLPVDSLSRTGKKLNKDMEWGLDQSVSDEIRVRMGRCNIDLFASSQNYKLSLYASYKPDKSAYAINAF